ncbi:hypothetical protein BDB00DRAFT_837602 [Zychaea mexicana]|uniref:uncharacterized protein n=1 Tax=Zychaea mexicana TaxID=64656 RepID=UPI0022FE120F|nr:uncharacterized protein BDB00DRAFT_837602 [Zychaea mexicana]KAI9490540.1 hypothetical protein BDB00DRAFT_837602 [Zychaea mexicana]
MYLAPPFVIFLCIVYFPHHNILDMLSMVLAPLRLIAYAAMLLYPKCNNPLSSYNYCIWLPPVLASFFHDGLRMYILLKSLCGRRLPVPYDTELFQLKTALTWLAIMIVFWTNAAVLQQALFDVTIGYTKKQDAFVDTIFEMLLVPLVPPLKILVYVIALVVASTSSSASWTLAAEQHHGVRPPLFLFYSLAMLQPVSSGFRALFLFLLQHQHPFFRWTRIKNILFTAVCYSIIHCEAVVTSRLVDEIMDFPMSIIDMLLQLEQ